MVAKPPRKEILTVLMASDRLVVPRPRDRILLMKAGVAFSTLRLVHVAIANNLLAVKGLVLAKPIPWVEYRDVVYNQIRTKYPSSKTAGTRIRLIDDDRGSLNLQVLAVQRHMSNFSMRCALEYDEVAVDNDGNRVTVQPKVKVKKGLAKWAHVCILSTKFDPEQQVMSADGAPLATVSATIGNLVLHLDKVQEPHSGKEVLHLRLNNKLVEGSETWDGTTIASHDTMYGKHLAQELQSLALQILSTFK
mgnify:CR=1 FL=1